MGHEVNHPVAVAKFIVIPGNELDKVVIESNASPSIEDISLIRFLRHSNGIENQLRFKLHCWT